MGMDNKLEKIRHSAAHILAQAVTEFFPDVKLAIGPATEEGFYYDFDCPSSFQPEDLERIEKRMHEIVAENHPFVQTPVSREEAVGIFTQKKQPYKLEILRDLDNQEAITTVRHGAFLDLCRGGHVQSTGEVKALKLLSVAGAYWRGSESNPMLQRIYGTAFASREELERYLKQREEALKRDHRKLGKALELFSFHPEGPGFPFWHPNGLVLYETLLGFWREMHRKAGYVEVRTPVVLADELWKRSGHYDHYKEHMYFTRIDEREFAIKPMNCPGGVLIYKETQHSYRDLPVRMAEVGLVHRHELSGVLHGLFRVKSFSIDDAHIFCSPGDMEGEIRGVIRLILEVYRTLGFEYVDVELSTRPERSLGTDAMWNEATQALEEALKGSGIGYQVQPGEGAFYGPKIDFHIRDSLDRTWQCGTIQVDFSMPERFELEYVAKDGKKARPVMIHRACFGSVERFLGILIEHFGGDFPLWLAPVQVKALSIAEGHAQAVRAIVQELCGRGIRAQGDLRSEKIGYKIREGELQKVPYLLVVGEREINEGTVSVRRRGKGDMGAQMLATFMETILKDINEKRR
ncbi:MAG: threonine--tRNA ligase [Candidatus Omnitrophica bacterium]|nr:threonine--tRNA ligase [Candidatus Omnitrophota bacterium]